MNIRAPLRGFACIGVLHLGLGLTVEADRSSELPELIALSDGWMAVEIGQDRAALERILDERFWSRFAASGRTVDRSTYPAWIMKCQIESFTVASEVVDIHGDATVVISQTPSKLTETR